MQKTKFEDDSVSANAHGGRLGGASEIAAHARPGTSAPKQHAAMREMHMVIFILTAAYYTISAPLPGHPRCGRPLVGGYA